MNPDDDLFMMPSTHTVTSEVVRAIANAGGRTVDSLHGLLGLHEIQ